MEDAHQELQRLRATIQRMQCSAEIENFVISAISARGTVDVEERTAYGRILQSHNNLISGHLFEVEYAQRGIRQSIEKEEAQDRDILQDCVTNRIANLKGANLNTSNASNNINTNNTHNNGHHIHNNVSLQQSYQSSVSAGSIAAFMPTPPDVPRQIGAVVGSQGSNYFSASPIPRPPAYQRPPAGDSPSASPTSSLGYRRSSAYSASLGLRSNIPSPVGVGHPLLPRGALSRMQRLQQDEYGSTTPQRQQAQPGQHGGGMTIGEGRGLSSAMSINDNSSPSPMYMRREDRNDEIPNCRPLPPPFHLTHPLPGRSGSGSNGSGIMPVEKEHREGRGDDEFQDDAEAAVSVLVPGVRFPLRNASLNNSNVQSITTHTNAPQQQPTPPRQSLGHHPLLPRVVSRAGRETPASVHMDDEGSVGGIVAQPTHKAHTSALENASHTQSTSGELKRSSHTKTHAGAAEQNINQDDLRELNDYDYFRPIDASSVVAEESVTRCQFIEEEERTRRAMRDEWMGLRRRQRSVIAGALVRVECSEMMARTKIETEEDTERRGGFKSSLAVVLARKSSRDTTRHPQDQSSQHGTQEVTLDDIPPPVSVKAADVLKATPTAVTRTSPDVKKTQNKPDFDIAFSSVGITIQRVSSKRVTFEPSVQENGSSLHSPKTSNGNASAPASQSPAPISRHSNIVMQYAQNAVGAIPSPPSTPCTSVSTLSPIHSTAPISPLAETPSSILRLPRRPSGGQVKFGNDAIAATVPQSGPAGEFLALYPNAVQSPPPAHVDRVREIGIARGGVVGGEEQRHGGKRVGGSSRSDPIQLNISEHLRYAMAPQTWA